jgi:isopenicillin N synthase-like dioxygenase
MQLSLQLLNKKNQNFKGYSPLLSGNNNPENAGDLQEGFEFGYEPFGSADNAERGGNDGAMAGPNVWPSALPGFREAALKY